MTENLRLLDRMHEGSIVISEENRKLQFASKPAMRYLKQQPESNNNNSSKKQSQNNQTDAIDDEIKLDQNDLYKPDIAVDGQEAIEAVKKEPTLLIL